DDVELNTWYHAAPAEAVHDMVIELVDFAVAVTPVGVDGGAQPFMTTLPDIVPELLIALPHSSIIVPELVMVPPELMVMVPELPSVTPELTTRVVPEPMTSVTPDLIVVDEPMIMFPILLRTVLLEMVPVGFPLITASVTVPEPDN